MKDKINGIIFSILKDLSEDLENENLKTLRCKQKFMESKVI